MRLGRTKSIMNKYPKTTLPHKCPFFYTKNYSVAFWHTAQLPSQ